MKMQEKFERMRHQLGWNKKECAEALGVSEQAVYYWTTGRRKIPPTALKLLEACLKNSQQNKDVSRLKEALGQASLERDRYKKSADKLSNAYADILQEQASSKQETQRLKEQVRNLSHEISLAKIGQCCAESRYKCLRLIIERNLQEALRELQKLHKRLGIPFNENEWREVLSKDLEEESREKSSRDNSKHTASHPQFSQEEMWAFETLGVKPGATLKECQSAFRKAAMEHHPDRGGTHNAFLEIRRAWDVLKAMHKKST